METFKQITAEKIAANEKSIKAFNERIADQKADAKIEYEQQIAELNRKNSDMKKKMEDFNAENKSSWDSFKTEFSHDMDELGNSIKNFTINNEK